MRAEGGRESRYVDRALIEPLIVLDRLEVGPPRVEPTRITVPYAVGDDTTDLVYRYDEPVFDPDDPVSHNLAAIIGAQVAFNYGLFAREIVFAGAYDEADRSLIRDMVENTSREIWVKKFREPNPYLRPPADAMPRLRLRQWTQAKLTFPNLQPRLPARPWGGPSDDKRIAVLASGGKDSLLSQAVLDELGCEVHALFGNESGRHWFTALNGYRALKDRFEHTARVWMNTDRVFSFMLRHLPFVRPDFLRVRADEYPVRLWTVAPFLFGMLPLMRKRGLDRIVIGDEFDTTRRLEFEGVPHHDGLFDQSRYFDRAMSAYFGDKGWNICAFSVLRPCSELLIQKTLVERYPELFAAQISCHAAHIDNEIVRPCGKCEKCRRIVGMVSAIGGDPALCGYGPEQVEHALKELAAKGVHQEAPCARKTACMLVDRGMILDSSPFGAEARDESVVLCLRFDASASPPGDVPRDLRPGLYRILLEHGIGAVVRDGSRWTPIDPGAPELVDAPFAFEPLDDVRDDIPPGRPCHILGELTWPQARRRFAATDVALLPVGAIEQHGPHLPLDIDAWDARQLALDVALACRDPKPLVLPLIPYGVSYHHEDFAGTIGVSPETLARIVHEIGLGVARWGVKKLVIINGHGGNIPALQHAAQLINRDAHIFTCVDTGETSDADIASLVQTPHDVHAGEYETSTTLHLRPESVYMERAAPCVAEFGSRYLDFGSSVSVDWYARTALISQSGVMGDPTRATADKGRKIWRLMVANLTSLVEHLSDSAIDELVSPRA